MRTVHFQNWKIQDIKKELETAKEQKFDTILIPVIQPLKEDNSNDWWMAYQTTGFSIGNQYGSKEDIIELCNQAREFDINIIVDVVCTHIGQEGFLTPHPKTDKKLTDNPWFWREKKNLSSDSEYNDRFKVTHWCAGGLPGLNLYNWDLQDIIIDFLNELIDCGVSGFRFDSGKSIALPEDKDFPCDFFPRVLGSLKRQDLFNCIEVLNAPQTLIDNYSKYGYVLTDVDSYNQNTIRYAESHDQYYNYRPNMKSPFRASEISNHYEQIAYRYENTLYYARPNNYDGSIDHLEWKSNVIKMSNNRAVCYQKVMYG